MRTPVFSSSPQMPPRYAYDALLFRAERARAAIIAAPFSSTRMPARRRQ